MKITGQHPAEDLLLSAAMPQSTDLRQIGLVDDIVEKPEVRDVGWRWGRTSPDLLMKFHKNLQIQQKHRFLLLCVLEPDEPLQDGCRHIKYITYFRWVLWVFSVLVLC